MNTRFLPRLLIIGATSLFGVSVAKLLRQPLSHGAVGGGLAGVIAVLVSLPFASATAAFERTRSNAELLGMRIAVVGLCCAFTGWIVTILLSHSFGYPLAAIGIVTGLGGILWHWASILRRRVARER